MDTYPSLEQILTDLSAADEKYRTDVRRAFDTCIMNMNQISLEAMAGISQLTLELRAGE